MIISPPFLPPRAAGQSDEAWLDVAMAAPPSRLSDTHAPEGSFPLSHNLSWHNGMHLQAPQAGGVSSVARAIADGKVIFAKAPSPPNDNVDHPQNYNPFDRPGTKTAAWTDNGCVIIEHRTTIGAEGTVETELVFYSLTMHLSALGKLVPSGQTPKRPLAAGDPIWRKDEIGTPGQIYGHAGQIHFEICFDRDNLQRLIGRSPSWVEPAQTPAMLPTPSADGRTDAIFGSLYFYLPGSTRTHAGTTAPTQHLHGATTPPGATAGTISTLGTSIWVKMTYHLGACTFESYDERGTHLAALPAETEAEYEMYAEATHRHASLSEADRAHSSPSGWYELMRFGRNIGRGTAATDKDPLPANAAHWRRVPGPTGGALWADLNAPGTFKFSDADFLPVMGWNCVSDDTNPNDQRCDSSNLRTSIRSLIETDPQDMEPPGDELLSKSLGNPGVQSMLRRIFCKFPSEWDKATATARYSFVQELAPFKDKDAPEAWPRLEAHLNGISFDGLPSEYLAADWRAHPREMVGSMRKFGWLSLRELAQLLPRRYGARGSLAEIPWGTAQQRFAARYLPLNRMLQKYGIESATRQTHFMAQTYIETAMWATMTEFGRVSSLVWL